MISYCYANQSNTPLQWSFCDLELPPKNRNLLDFCYLLPKIQNYIIWCENLISLVTMMGGGMMFVQ